MRGFMGGVIWGAVTSGIGISAFSLAIPMAQAPDLSAEVRSGANTVPKPDASVTLENSTRRDADVAEIAPTNLPNSQQGSESTAAKVMDPGEKPAVADVAEAPAAPDSLSDAEIQVVVQSWRATATPDVSETQIPAQQSDDVPTVQRSRSTQVPAVQDDAGSVEAAPENGRAPYVSSRTDEVLVEITTGDVQAPDAVSALSIQTTPADQPEPVSVARLATTPYATSIDAPRVNSTTSTPAVSRSAPVTDRPRDPDVTVVADVQPAEPLEPFERQALPQAESDEAAPSALQNNDQEDTPQVAEPVPLQPTVGKRVVPLTERNGTSQGAAVVQAPEAKPADPNAPPLQAFATPFENPEAKPLMSVVLLDDADADVDGVAALDGFPFPVTFAIDPTKAGAADRMARHRAAGFEVVALVDLPNGATAQDAEVNLSAMFDALPEALALLEGDATGIQSSRDLSRQVNAFASATGRGVILRSSGLNSALRDAERQSVPAAVVFRDFDGAGQNAGAIRRFLDQAAFRAGQEGGVVMVGRVRTDTITALQQWASQDRSSRVALAPVSALLSQSTQ